MATKSTRSSGTQHNSRGVTQGTTLVGPQSGLPIDEIVDSNGVRRIAVDGNFTAQNVQVTVDLDVDEDGVHIGDPDTGFTLQVEPDGSINTNVEVDAADGDNIAVSGHVNPIHDRLPDTITSAAFETIYTYTSLSNNTKVVRVKCMVSTPALIRVKVGATIIDQFWTSPTDRNAKFDFEEHLPLASGAVLTVEAQVDRFLHASYDTFTSLQGYTA